MIFYEGSASYCPSLTVRTIREQSNSRKHTSHTHIVRFNRMISFAQVKQMAEKIKQTAKDAQKSSRQIKRYVFDFEMVKISMLHRFKNLTEFSTI